MGQDCCYSSRYPYQSTPYYSGGGYQTDYRPHYSPPNMGYCPPPPSMGYCPPPPDMGYAHLLPVWVTAHHRRIWVTVHLLQIWVTVHLHRIWVTVLLRLIQVIARLRPCELFTSLSQHFSIYRYHKSIWTMRELAYTFQSPSCKCTFSVK